MERTTSTVTDYGLSRRIFAACDAELARREAIEPLTVHNYNTIHEGLIDPDRPDLPAVVRGLRGCPMWLRQKVYEQWLAHDRKHRPETQDRLLFKAIDECIVEAFHEPGSPGARRYARKVFDDPERSRFTGIAHYAADLMLAGTTAAERECRFMDWLEASTMTGQVTTD